MNSKKSLVYTLIFLLTFTSIVGLFSPAQADDGWTDITLPFTISASGNYRIIAPWYSDTVDTQGLTITANNVVVDGQNYAINVTYTEDGTQPSGVYANGQSNILLENLNITSSYCGIRLISCSNFTVSNCSSTKCIGGLVTNSCHDFTVYGYNSSKDLMMGLSISNCKNFTLDSCNVYYPTLGNYGIYISSSNNFVATHLAISRCYIGFTASWCSNYTLQDSGINRTSNMGFWGGNGQNVTVAGCTFDLNSGYAIYAWLLNDFKVIQNTITNNSQAIKVGSSTVLFSDNYVATNGIYQGSFYGGFYSSDSTCTITGNTFDRNYDAFMWVVEDDTSQQTCTITDNVFQNNAYTFYFYYTLPAGSTNQKLLFSNNLVNDIAYFDTNCLGYCMLPIADKVVNLNSTLSLGFRPYSNGPQIGGNFWAHPDGTGPSQTGTDADHDGFIDTTFDIFNDAVIGSAIDYHPYSLEFDINTWVPFTLPAAIEQPGNYRLVSPWVGNVTGLSISASNVVVDGQNNLIDLSQSDGEVAILITPGSTNIVLTNINQTCAGFGLFAVEASFTVQNSRFTNNTSSAIFAIRSADCFVTQTLLSNNSYSLFTVQSSNFTITHSHIRNSTIGIEPLLSDNMTIQSCYLSDNTEAFKPLLCTNTTIDDCLFRYNDEAAINATYTSLTVNNTSIIDNDGIAISCFNGNLTAVNFECTNNTIGIYTSDSTFNATHGLLNDNIAGIFAGYGNATLRDCALEYNIIYGAVLIECNTAVNDCSFSNNELGIMALGCRNLVLENSRIFNNTEMGLEQYLSNSTVTGSLFSQNGFDPEYFGGAIMTIDTNCTVTNNAFTNNYDSLMFGAFDPEVNNTQSYYYNSFNNNSFTFDFNYQLPSNYTNQQIYFYNNLVNDTSYVNPESFTQEYQYAPPTTVFHLNTTLQPGQRAYSAGVMIGGNYWAHPNGTGPSQTGIDANKDGFIDTAFDLFGNQTVYDYLPYSSNYQTHLIYTAGASQSLAVNQSSALISIQTVDYYGAIIPGATVTLSSNSTTGRFYSDAACTQTITSITIPAGSSTVGFYYKDMAAGTPILTASAQGLTPAATNFTINTHADTVEYITISPADAAVAVGKPINFTTTAYDQYGNSWNVTDSAVYYVNDIPMGGNTLQSGYLGPYTVTTTFAGKTASTTVLVTTGSLDRFAVLVSNSAAADGSFNIMVAAMDGFGNTVTGFTGTVALSVSQGTLSQSTSGSFQRGVWTGSLSISGATDSVVISVDDGNGHKGNNTLTIGSTAPTPTPSPTPKPSQTSTITAATDTGTLNLAITGNITASQISGAAITTSQSAAITTLSFTVTGPSGTTGFCNITIPKTQVPYGTAPVVSIDGKQAQNQGYTEDTQNYYVWFTTSFSTHQIEIQFTAQETAQPQLNLLWFGLIFVILAIAVASVLMFTRRKHK